MHAQTREAVNPPLQDVPAPAALLPRPRKGRGGGGQLHVDLVAAGGPRQGLLGRAALPQAARPAGRCPSCRGRVVAASASSVSLRAVPFGPRLEGATQCQAKQRNGLGVQLVQPSPRYASMHQCQGEPQQTRLVSFMGVRESLEG